MTTKKKRKTRLKGTETKKPCFDCGKTKDRFKDFKPRWAGCVTHRTPNGRRYFQKGCADCKALVNGNIRQPRCIGCDKLRPKKRKAKAAAAAVAPTPTVAETPPAPKVEAPKVEPVAKVEAPKVEPVAKVEAPKVEPVAKVEAPKVEPVAKVEAKVEASPESVKLPEPEAPKPKPKPVATSAADIFALLEADEDA